MRILITSGVYSTVVGSESSTASIFFTEQAVVGAKVAVAWINESAEGDDDGVGVGFFVGDFCNLEKERRRNVCEIKGLGPYTKAVSRN